MHHAQSLPGEARHAGWTMLRLSWPFRAPRWRKPAEDLAIGQGKAAAPLPVTIGDATVGHVATGAERLRFFTADTRLADIDGMAFASIEAARRLASAILASRDIAPGLASGGSAAGRMLLALLRDHPNLKTWG